MVMSPWKAGVIFLSTPSVGRATANVTGEPIAFAEKCQNGLNRPGTLLRAKELLWRNFQKSGGKGAGLWALTGAKALGRAWELPFRTGFSHQQHVVL